MRQGLARMQNAALYRSFASWQESTAERKRMMRLLQKSMHSLVMSQVKRGWRGWMDFLADREEVRRIEQVRKRASARLKNPKLLGMYDHWHQQQRLAAMERGDFALGGMSLPARICVAMGLGKCAGVPSS